MLCLDIVKVLSSVLLTPWNTEPWQSLPTTNCSRRKKITSTKHSKIASTQHGLWTGQILDKRTIEPTSININRNFTGNNKNKPSIVVPYMKGISESCKNICRKCGIEMYFKGGTTIKELLVHPKDKDAILQKSGVIYTYKCGRMDCEEEYIGESSRTFAERVSEHKKAPSPIHDHFNTPGHELSLNNFSIVDREDQIIARAIKEAMLIRVNDPFLNRNISKYQLPHIWDEVLVKLLELKLK